MFYCKVENIKVWPPSILGNVQVGEKLICIVYDSTEMKNDSDLGTWL